MGEEQQMDRVQVTIRALDVITSAGLATCLEAAPNLVVTGPDGQADVVVAAFDRLSANAVATLRAAASEVRRPVVLIVNEIREVDLLPAVECRVVAILPRAAASDDRLAQAIQTAAAGG